MNINVNNSIRIKYHEGFNRVNNPVEIVIHGTGGGSSAAAMISWMEGGERSKEYARGIGLYHYLIDFGGEIYEIINPNRWVYHSSSGAHDALTVGVELMNKSPNNSNEYTDEQYEALFDLISELMAKYSIKTIVGHGKNGKEFSGMDKNCPGNFDWKRLGQYLTDNRYQYEYEPRKYYKIRRA